MFWLANTLSLAPLQLAATFDKLPGINCTQALHNQGNIFFFLPHWWEYLAGKVDPIGQCSPVFNGPTDAWLVALAILDMLLRLAGFAATVSIIVAGIEYITAVGNAERVTNARKRIVNSLAGLAIALVATLLVAFVGRTFGQ